MKPTFKVNQKAPRMGKKEFSTQVITKDLFKRFKEEYPEYKSMKWNEFLAYWADIAETIRSEGVTNPLGVKLGYYLGELKTQYLPYKYEATNISASNEEGEKVKHLNIVTRGKVGKIKWERRWAVRFNKILQFYAFEEDRKMHDLAKDYIPKNPEKIRTARITLGGRRTWK